MREVARGVAERLGFALVDEGIILRAAAEAGVDADTLADEERRRSFVDRALASAGTTVGGSAAGAGGMDSFYAASFAAPTAHGSAGLRGFIRAAIEETAERGSVVIVAHAASHALAAQPNVLRVLVTASRSAREARIASEQNLDAKAAARALDRSDAARADYLKRFYGLKSELPTQYDIVLSTDRLSADEVASLVALAASN